MKGWICPITRPRGYGLATHLCIDSGKAPHHGNGQFRERRKKGFGWGYRLLSHPANFGGPAGS